MRKDFNIDGKYVGLSVSTNIQSPAVIVTVGNDSNLLIVFYVQIGVSLDIENYCTLRLFFDLSTLAGLSRRNLPEAGIRLLFQI